jgi:hypothetical protein
MAQYRKLNKAMVMKSIIAIAILAKNPHVNTLISQEQVKKAIQHLPEIEMDSKSLEFFRVPSHEDPTHFYTLQVNGHTSCDCPHCTTPTGVSANICWHKVAARGIYEAVRS